MRPRIAITTWRRPLPTFLGDRTLLYTLGDEYVACVAGAGAVPLLLPHLRAADVGAALDVVDGLVVAGGGDVDPSTYGAAPAGSHGTDRQADASEVALLRMARERGMPTLAICRGMQLVNVAHGGTLHQEIGVPGGAHEPISDDPAAALAARHEVEVVQDSLLAEVLGPGGREVNTIHHQAIDRLADDARAVAVASDGVIEAIEVAGWPLLAVQWHPEKAPTTEAALFTWLVQAARDRSSASAR